jgi:hypothetical protein
MLTEEVAGEAYKSCIASRTDSQLLQKWSGVAEEEGDHVNVHMGALDDEGPRSWEMGSEAPEYPKVSRRINTYFDINRR